MINWWHREMPPVLLSTPYHTPRRFHIVWSNAIPTACAAGPVRAILIGFLTQRGLRHALLFLRSCGALADAVSAYRAAAPGCEAILCWWMCGCRAPEGRGNSRARRKPRCNGAPQMISPARAGRRKPWSPSDNPLVDNRFCPLTSYHRSMRTINRKKCG